MSQELELSEQLINEGFTPFGEIEELTKEQILDKEIFEHIFSIENQLVRTELIVKLEERAKQIGATILYEPEYVQDSPYKYICFGIQDIDGNIIEIENYER